MPAVRRRRQVASGDGDVSEPTSNPPKRGRPSRQEEPEAGPASQGTEEDDQESEDNTEVLRMAKKLVRMVLAAENTRSIVHRTAISEKVLEKSQRGMFSLVFQSTQQLLRDILGMELRELPARSVPLRVKKRGAPAAKTTSSNKGYVLVSTLPDEFRGLDILKPRDDEGLIYNGVLTAIASIVLLSGGKLAGPSLAKYLTTIGLGVTTPLADSTEELLQRMVKDQYLERGKEDELGIGEDMWMYSIGPRAKIELSEGALIKFVTGVYGNRAPADLGDLLVNALKEAKQNLQGVVDTESIEPGDSSLRLKSIADIDGNNVQAKNKGKKAKGAQLLDDDNSDGDSGEDESDDAESSESDSGDDDDDDDDDEESDGSQEGSEST